MQFGLDVLRETFNDLTPGGFLVELDSPPGVTPPRKCYKFGPTPDDPPPHCYDFAYDGDPSSPDYGTGAVIVGGVIHLHFIYGRRGVDPSATDGESVGPGGPGFFAPEASVSGPDSGDPGQAATFSLSATDLSAAALAAGFTYTINWGDGRPSQIIAPASGNGAGITEPHVFSNRGSYTVQVTAADDNGLVSNPASVSIEIGRPPVDPNYPLPTTPRPTAMTPPTAASPQIMIVVVAGQSRKGLISFAIIFNEPLNEGSATDGSKHCVLEGVMKVVKKHRVTLFTKAMAIRTVSLRGSGDTVTINLARVLKGTVEVMVQGTMTAANGSSSSVNSVKRL
jgi:hypothetical protein